MDSVWYGEFIWVFFDTFTKENSAKIINLIFEPFPYLFAELYWIENGGLFPASLYCNADMKPLTVNVYSNTNTVMLCITIGDALNGCLYSF